MFPIIASFHSKVLIIFKQISKYYKNACKNIQNNRPKFLSALQNKSADLNINAVAFIHQVTALQIY